MRKIANNDVSKDSTMVTRTLSDGGDRIWEIRDIKNAAFLEKEAVHASFSRFFLIKKNIFYRYRKC